jgi:hypothetical protein
VQGARIVKRIWPTLALVAACSTGANSPKSGPGAAGLALIAGNLASATEVSLIEPSSSQLVKDDCLDSASVTSLSPPLSAEVGFASLPEPDHRLLLIDRAQAALDWIVPATCQVSRQLEVGTGFASRPRDVVVLSATKAYVTRAATNPTPSGELDAFDGGDDLLIIDPADGRITGRIDLAGQATSATLQAQPDHALLANGKIYVSLANQSADGKTIGHGRVLVIDPATDRVVATIDLPALKACSGLDYLPATKDLVVGCGGDPGDTLDNQTAQSAIVLVNIGAAAPSVMSQIGGAAAGNRPLSAATFAVIADDFALAVSPGGGAGGAPDSLWRLQLDSGTATHVLDGSAGAVFGSLVWDSSTHRVYLTDAAAGSPVVRVFDVSNSRDTPQTATFVASPHSGLPPRLLAFY